jgi:ubiquinone/menaquinone biosynthesis C-methylase UbiE
LSHPNYFAERFDARVYARGRPDIHPTAIEKFRAFTKMSFCRALDVGCGTGQSTAAVAQIADCVIGVDPSSEMLRNATPHPRVDLVQSLAEALPFPDRQFDLVVAAQAFHWFDVGAFMAESNRLLEPAGWLLVYSSWFNGEMVEAPTFSEWENAYLKRYPTPPRNRTPLTNEFARQHGFELRGHDGFWQKLPMTMDMFTEFRLSTTNVIAAVQQGRTTFDETANWIRATLVPFFAKSNQRTFVFGGMLWYVQKT